MSYQVLAQKYRPQTFEDVIGQETVTRTLTNSIEKGRIANAYIFCGPRGVGKTSIARLLSKTLNCEKGPENGPCNKCASCREIAQGSNIDVLEIDGASNRGIDEIRALRENVKFSPSRGKFKIYIIDEVHMLTQEAFNALLKTLEEPPAHVKFIFATTEPHKVLPTIMSRCQRFDFKRIPPGMMYDRILEIAGKEKINIEEKAALLMARSADGSLRDSLVILDQMVSFSGNRIAAADVVELLGMVHRESIFGISEAVINKDAAAAASMLDDLINNGKDPVFIANSLIGHYRDLMILKTAGKPTSDMAFSEDERKELNTQLERLSLEEILYILQNLSHCLTLMKGAMFARAPLEITLIRLTKRAEALSIPGLLERLENAGSGCCESSGAPKGQAAVNSVRQASASARSGTGSFPEASTDPENGGFGGDDFEAMKYHWKSVLNYVRSRKMSVFTFLSVAHPVEFTDKKVVIGFGKDHAFNKEALEAENNRIVIQEAVDKITGNTPRLELTLLEFLGEGTETGVEKEKEARTREEMKPVIEKAMDVFGGHVIRDIKGEER